MDRFARVVHGYHGCRREFANRLLLGETQISRWQGSENNWDWLGRGIYFWEHSPERAQRWSAERYGAEASVIGAAIQLGRCFDLLNEAFTAVLARTYPELRRVFAERATALPANRGREGKLRELDCLVINDCLSQFDQQNVGYDTVRGAFWEGDPIYPTAGFSREAHIQIAVRNPDAILGVFRPNLENL
ncbi:MAG TPA: hypothetical protein VGE52_06105 [Pirellulales bacterium]